MVILANSVVVQAKWYFRKILCYLGQILCYLGQILCYLGANIEIFGANTVIFGESTVLFGAKAMHSSIFQKGPLCGNDVGSIAFSDHMNIRNNLLLI